MFGKCSQTLYLVFLCYVLLHWLQHLDNGKWYWWEWVFYSPALSLWFNENVSIISSLSIVLPMSLRQTASSLPLFQCKESEMDVEYEGIIQRGLFSVCSSGVWWTGLPSWGSWSNKAAPAWAGGRHMYFLPGAARGFVTFTVGCKSRGVGWGAHALLSQHTFSECAP